MYYLIQVLLLVLLNMSSINANECTINTPCPTSCSNGYTPGTAHTMDGCTVYCTTEPVDGQCQEGGSGCESSCYPTVTKDEDADEDEEGEGSSRGGIIGVIIGSVFCLIGFSTWWYFYYSEKPTQDDDDSVNTPLVHSGHIDNEQI